MEARRREHERQEEQEARERREERRERHEARLEPVERPRYEGLEARAFGIRDLVHWGSVWAGLLSAFGIMILLGLLGLAVGLSAVPTGAPGDVGTTSAIWGVIMTIVAFFVGGWVAGRTSSYRGTNFSGFILGSMVWALGVALVTLLTALGIGGVAGAAVNVFGVPSGVTPGQLGAAQNAAIGAFIAVVLAYIASVGGAIIGVHQRYEEYQGR